jgi:hypothetical protein
MSDSRVGQGSAAEPSLVEAARARQCRSQLVVPRRQPKCEIRSPGILLRCLGCLAGLGDWSSGAGQCGRLFEHKLRSGRLGPLSVSRSTYAQRLLQVNSKENYLQATHENGV